MNIEEFAKLEVGDYVTVKPWEEIARIAPVEIGRYCDKKYRVRVIDKVIESVLLEKNDETPIGRVFMREMLELVKTGFLCYDPIDEECGKIGKKTKIIDDDGVPLCIGDVVNVKRIPPKEVREAMKKTEKILEDLGIGKKAKVIAKVAGSDSIEKVFTTVVVEREGEAFVCGIQEDYNEKIQKTDEWQVTKIIDHSAVRNGAVIEHIRFNREL